MPNALLKGTYADLDGNELTSSGEEIVGWVTVAQTAATNGRYYRTSNAVVKLPDGRFFTAGGEVGSQTLSEIINTTATASVLSGNTTANRTQGVRLVLLNNGDVLVVGGNASPTTSETWNSGSGLFTARGACTHVEDGGIAALDDGNAVVYGGVSSGTPLNTTQIYSATGFTFSATGNMVNARTAFGRSFRVAGGTIGKVFVAGGTLTSGDQTATTEQFDGDTGIWTAKASMAFARGDSCNVKLPNGHIMVAGGINTFANNFLSSVEIYNPTGDSWSTVGSLVYARVGAHGVALSDGRVIVAGGIAPNLDDINLPTEIYNPVTQTWSVLTGPLNYTPPSFSDPLHAIYGADVQVLDGVDGLESVIAIGGKAAAPGTFPAGSLRDIRHLVTTTFPHQIDQLINLKYAYDKQSSKPFIFGTNVNQSLATGKKWIVQSPEPGFGPLFHIYADTTAEPTYGSGVLVSGQTFHSSATQNIFEAPTTHGSQTFTINNNTDTIPSDKQIVRLLSAIGDVAMAGTPTISPGLFEGQRLITIIDSDSTGYVQFAITGGGGIQPISSPFTLQHYGSDYQEAVEWVWVDGFWKTVCTPAQNPITIPLSGSVFYGPVNANQGLRYGEENWFIDPGDSTIFVGSSRLTVSLTTADLLLTQTPTIDAPVSPGDEFAFIITNKADSGYNLILQDDSIASGTNLFLATPMIILREGDWIELIYTNAQWRERSRSRQESIFTTNPLSGFITVDVRGADLVQLDLSNNATLDAPAIDGYFYDRQEVTIWNDPSNIYTFTLEDNDVTTGTLLKLSSSRLILSPGDSVKLKYNATDTMWYEIDRWVINGWQTLSLVNGWDNFGGSWPASPVYSRDAAGVVRVRFALYDGTSGTTATTLPLGYRPPYELQFSAFTGAGDHARIYVAPSGIIQINDLGSSNVNANGAIAEFNFSTLADP